MNDFSTLLQQGSANAWFFIPSAILLGALHGLEPGHSKTMMAAFIVAIRGTVTQAALLGLAATVSHTAVVWAVALVGMHFGSQYDAETTEPYFQLASGILIIGVALWMLYRTWREHKKEKHEADHSHSHHHYNHGHEEVRRIDTGHGMIVELTVYEDGVPPRFWLAFEKDGKVLAPSPSQRCSIETIRPDKTRQTFQLINRGAYMESVEEIPEPHDFTARLTIAHDNHAHNYDVVFSEHDHGEDHHHKGLELGLAGYQDAHELAHANEIKQRFNNGNVTTGQIIIFGLTGGLIPCPAAITVLLICLQLKEFTLGVTMVLCFSIGLALTLVASGTIAAIGVRHASKRFSGFGKFARRAPYFSSALIICIGLYVCYHGLQGLL
ncbi:MAG: nickel/cobalt efflux protein RcnA [Alphaproteobacteria bacterium]